MTASRSSAGVPPWKTSISPSATICSASRWPPPREDSSRKCSTANHRTSIRRLIQRRDSEDEFLATDETQMKHGLKNVFSVFHLCFIRGSWSSDFSSVRPIPLLQEVEWVLRFLHHPRGDRI